ncbi:MAG: TetR/AcrR family transcriptional regulator [Phycisphaerales bacterium]|nr:TetR/AcrR family transcriptional regulator [Phycisphaerales bacterium]
MAKAIWSVAPRARASETRERLLDAAAMLFYEHGFHAIGLDAILEEVGVTKTTFYNHFASKDELIVAVLLDRDERDMQAVREEMARRGGSARDRILLVFDVLDDWFNDPDFKGCLFINASAQFPNPNDPVHQAATKHTQSLHAMLVELADEARAQDPALLAKKLCMLIAAAITLRQVACDPAAAHTAREMAVALLDRSLGGG